MKKFVTAAALVLFVWSSLANARPPTKKWTVNELAAAVSEAFTSGDTSKLDADRALVGKVRIVIENTLGEPTDPDHFAIRTFTTFARLEKWLKSREHDGGPGRNAGAVKKCAKGICTFEPTGMLHNNLYLIKISYGIRGGSAYVKSIYIEDGN